MSSLTGLLYIKNTAKSLKQHKHLPELDIQNILHCTRGTQFTVKEIKV